MTDIILQILVLSIFALLQCKMNSKRINRSRYAILVVCSAIYCCVCLFFAYRNPNWGIDAVHNAVALEPIRGINSMSVVWMNLVMHAIYLVVRILPWLIFVKIFKNKEFCKKVIDVFYYYSDDCEAWVLYKQWTNVRKLFKVFIPTGVILSGTILGIMVHANGNYNYATVIFPVFFLIMLVEIYNFLNGYNEVEYKNEVLADEVLAQDISNFYKIREIYEKMFPREMLNSCSGSEYSSTQAVKDVLEKYAVSENETERKVSEFFSLVGEREIYDADCIEATLSLLKGENVIFYNPFYRDLGKYLILPVLNTLLSDKKCLVIVGRNSVKQDVKDWLTNILDEYGKINELWRVKELDFKAPDCEVGIVGFSQIYDQQILEANKDFFKEVGFVFVHEASLMLNTAQVGLSILGQQMKYNGEEPIYCISDRLVDGLLDTMSHLLQIEITNVVASPMPRNMYTIIGWNADGDYLRQRLFDKQTKYLGNGIELAAVAIKNQVPHVTWYGETKVPIKDIKWMAGQYYHTLCRYMNLPTQQQSVYDKIQFVSNIWSATEENEQFVIAEDEFSSIFNTIRIFMSRGKNQTFVNVLTENYLLRDYMRCNTQMFMSNPNAIPSIVPDYAKTERNVLLKLVILMTYREVYESEIIRELNLIGFETDDALYGLSVLLKKYTDCDNGIFSVRLEKREVEDKRFDEENVYTVTAEKFEDYFGESLKNAYYICEEERLESEYIDAKLFGHVTQNILPDQFVVYGGKNYIVNQISAKNGVVLRRASNLYERRKYYRQIRRYTLSSEGEVSIIADKKVMDVHITKLHMNVEVTTSGYLEMKNNSDLRSARVVDFSKDPSVGGYRRYYRNKALLKMAFPDTTDKMRYTICMLLSEVMRSIFPDGWQYLAVVTTIPDDIEGMLNYLIYDVDGEVDSDYIYIIEDSEIDLGLLEAVEKNLFNFLEIITDYLCWHFEKMREPAYKDPEISTAEFPKMDVKKKKKFTEMFTRIRTLFGTKKEPEQDSFEIEETKISGDKKQLISDSTEENEVIAKPFDISKNSENVSENNENLYLHEDEIIDSAESAVDTSVKVDQPEQKKIYSEEQLDPTEENPDILAIDGTDIFDNDSNDEDNEYFEEKFKEIGITPVEKSRYQKECYLKFGFEEIDSRIQLEEVRKYFTVRGFSNHSLTKARRRNAVDETIIDIKAVNHCDFCGLPLSGVSFDKLSDGRIRCKDCAATAINSLDEFKNMFSQILSMMQSYFGIDYRTPITVCMTDARKIAKGYGSVFKPSTDCAERILGYAQRKSGKFSLYIENGSPRLAAIDTMVHELTHIWQYVNWKDSDIARLYPEAYKRDIVYEGMAMWAAVQYLYLIGEYSYAQKQEMLALKRKDIYGVGFKMFSEQYPLIKDQSLIKITPFNQFPPL